MKQSILPIAVQIFFLACACTPGEWVENRYDNYAVISQKGSPDIGYCPSSGIEILNVDGRPFKDLNRNGRLDVYEDWRQPMEVRAADLAGQMDIEQIFGLMLYSPAQNLDSAALTAAQHKFICEDGVRHVLIAGADKPGVGASWSNNMQALCESMAPGIPANNSSDPRHYIRSYAEFNAGSGGKISYWPMELGLAATFDPELVRRFAEIASTEYRALGITTALSPQADIASDPRWMRYYGTFGESPQLCRDLTRAYVDAFQTTPGSKTGWGMNSVNCMVKHWPGGGSGEGGRDAHFGFGKYAVYPGGRFDLALIPFLEGAFNLAGKTAKASAVMPYYTISYGQDPSGCNVGNAYSKYIITDLLRDKYGYDGVVCTDWSVVRDETAVNSIKSGKCWGVESFTPAQKRKMVLEAGCDQFGGVSDKTATIEAYNLWVEEYGKESAEQRFRLSAKRLLLNIFRTGLFENPYVDPQVADEIVGCEDYVAEGMDAQHKSIVMIKNHASALPMARGSKVYLPLREIGPTLSMWRTMQKAITESPFPEDLVGGYFTVVENPEEADFAIVTIKAPAGHWGYKDPVDGEDEGRYLPISLQFNDYTAETAREVSMAGGDPFEKSSNRSYRGATEITYNQGDLLSVVNTRKLMGDKPVVVVANAYQPFIMAEVEPYADAILLAFCVSNQSMLDIVSGDVEPSALLPFQLPADMETVEASSEDVPFDLECYKDADGNVYDFAFGLNWKGVIKDARTEKYSGRL